MRCNNISLNNSQGHPGKEGPNGEKGHMVSFFISLSLSSLLSSFWSFGFRMYLGSATSLSYFRHICIKPFALMEITIALRVHVCVCVCTVMACVLQNSNRTFISPGPRWPSRTHRLSWAPRREGEMIINH